MAVIKEILLFCDECGCGENNASDDRHLTTAKAIRKARRFNGWHYSGSKDYCPECWEKRKTHPPSEEIR